MNVLHVIDSGGLYGAEVMLLSLVREQIRLGMTPVIASIGEHGSGEKPLEVEARKRGFQVKVFRMKPGLNIKGALDILDYARINGIQVIHSHGYKGNILLGFIPRTIRNIPVVSTVHGYTSDSGFSKMRVYEILDRISHFMLDRVVLVNREMMQKVRFTAMLGVSYDVVNNGIASAATVYSKTRGCDDSVGTFADKGHIFGSIGRLSREKGYYYLIRAFARLVEQGMDTRLIIVGEGRDKNRLEKLVNQLNLKDRVLFTGYVQNARELIPRFHTYVISSLTEGLPITLLETMHAGVPVVATRVGGIPDVIRHEVGGLLVEPGRAEPLSIAMELMVKDKELAFSMAEKAFKTVRSFFSAEKMAREYGDVYRKICKHVFKT